MADALTPLEKRTMKAVGSNNPFMTPTPPPQSKKAKKADPIAEKVLEEAETISFEDEIPDRSEELEGILAEEDSHFQIPKPPESKTPLPDAINPIVETQSYDGFKSFRAEWEGKDLFVGFPCYKTTNPATAWVLLAMALDLGREKIRFDMELGDAMIYHARNRLARKFLQTEANWFLMLDDDMIPAIGRPGFLRSMCGLPDSVQDSALQRHVIHRLIGAGKTLIGGAYFGRRKGARLMTDLVQYENDVKIHADKVLKCKWVGTGCMLIHRKVFEDIQKHYPELKPKDPEEPFDFFRPIGNGVGEDVSFCYRASKAGHDPHIDLGLPIYHVGYHCYGSGTI